MDVDCAKAILKTYHQVNDTPSNQNRIQRLKLGQKTKELEHELSALKEKYTLLQNELSNRDERLSRLNRQLIDRTSHMERLQEDFENAIYQLTNRKEGA
jgi:predicted  nucleic acid-binding Zn-ribbon protein